MLRLKSFWAQGWMLALMALWTVGCETSRVDPSVAGPDPSQGVATETRSAEPLRVAAASQGWLSGVAQRL